MALLGLLAAVLLAAPAPVTAQEAETSWAYAIANELMSPYCPGRTLAECPSPQAGELRAWITVQAAAGRTRQDVLEELYERFGDEIRPTPKVEGIGITAYALPILAFLCGGVLVVVVLRRLTSGGVAEPQSAAASPPTDDAELQRIVDEELRS